MEIKPFKKIDGNGYSFREIWKIYDEQFNILRDIVLSLGDKYQVDNVSGSDDKIITLDIPYNSNQVFVYFNGVLQWKDRDYRENSPTEIELLFDRKATDDLRIVTIKSNVIKEDLHQYLHDIDIVVKNAKEQYDSARSLESRLVELYSSLQQTHSLYTNNSTTSLVNDLTRLKNEYEKVRDGVNALDIKLKDLISSSEYVLATVNLDSLKELVNSIKENLADITRERSLDIIVPVYDTYKSSNSESGDCEIIGIDKKHWFMIDCYMRDDYIYQNIKRCLSENHINKLDFILITHYHDDHYGNIVKLCDDGLVNKVYIPDVSKTSFQSGKYSMDSATLLKTDKMIKDACTRNSISCEVAPVGTIDFHGASLTFYNNSNEDYENIKKFGSQNYNDVSVCLLVDYIGRTAVFEGDVSHEGMLNTVRYIPTNADFLKSHHHGITTMPIQYKKIHPNDVFVTASRKYMHGNQVTHSYMSQLTEMGSNIFALADQVEDMHIEYLSTDRKVKYNRRLVKDGYNYQGSECCVYVDKNYIGDLQSGDRFTPFKYLSDAIRYVHQVSQDYVQLIIKSGDYSSDAKNINEMEKDSSLSGYLQLKNCTNQISVYPWDDGEVILPAMYIRGCRRVEFYKMTFKKQPNCPKINNNVNCNSSNVWFSGCKFINTYKVNNDCHIVVNEYARVICDSITFNGNVDYGIVTNDSECSVTVKGNNTVKGVSKVYFPANGSIINVVNPFKGQNNVEVSNTNSTSNVVFSKKSKGLPDVSGTTVGQIINAFNPYNGIQYYISDGSNGWSVVDQYNIHGDMTKSPNFVGQFAYDSANKKVGFSVGASSKSDWVDLTKEDKSLFDTLHVRPENSTLPTSNKDINNLGAFITYYDRNVIPNQPSQYGQLINLPCRVEDSSESMQLWVSQNDGNVYSRGGNSDISVYNRKFQSIYPDNMGDVDVLLYDWVTSPTDAKNRNVRLRKPFKDYKIITFYLVPDDGYNWVVPCSFHVSELRTAIKFGRNVSPNVGGYMVSGNGLFWDLNMTVSLLDSTDIGSMTIGENCKLMAVTGWPRVYGLDSL